MGSPLFFNTSSPQPIPSSYRNLVEFKAGKLELRDKMVVPNRRKGLVYVRQEDNLMHLYWRDRTTGEVEDDLILIPEDCEFKRVQSSPSPRVFVLTMKSANKKMFFWMQEPKADRDDEFCKKINDLLNNPPRSGSDMGGPSSERDFSHMLGNITQEQVSNLLTPDNLSFLLNSAAGRSPLTSGGAPGGHSQSRRRDSSPTMREIQALMMEGSDEEANALLASMAASREAGNAGSGRTAQGSQQQQQPMIDLSTAINSDSLADLLQDGDFLKLLEPHLPPVSGVSPNDQQQLSSEELKKQVSETIRSSQFRSSLSQFCVALQSGQLGPLMSQFGLNQACVDAASLGNLEAFIRALEAQQKSTSSSEATGENPKPSDSSSTGSEQKEKN